MERVRRHQRLLSGLSFGLLAVLAELIGAGLTHRLDLGRHVRSPGYSHAAYYPAVVIAVKVGIALLLASLVWRMLRAHAIKREARRIAGVGGGVPRVRITLSPRLGLAFFALTATTYLVYADVNHRVVSGRWALFFPWVHSSALPVFAVLSVLLALLWSAVRRWLADYEQLAEDAARLARALGRARPAQAPFPHAAVAVPPRRLFGSVLNSRPPPLGA